MEANTEKFTWQSRMAWLIVLNRAACGALFLRRGRGGSVARTPSRDLSPELESKAIPFRRNLKRRADTPGTWLRHLPTARWDFYWDWAWERPVV